jgi:hypothetical protein
MSLSPRLALNHNPPNLARITGLGHCIRPFLQSSLQGVTVWSPRDDKLPESRDWIRLFFVFLALATWHVEGTK